MNELKIIREALQWAIPYVARLRDTEKLSKALQALAELEQKNKWLPISEAPKEITRILAYGEYPHGWSIETIEWGENWCSHGCYIPTHFQYLPTPPKE